MTPYLIVVAIDMVLIIIWEFISALNSDTKEIMFLVTVIGIAMIPFSAITYLRMKTPKFDDNFAIRGMAERVV